MTSIINLNGTQCEAIILNYLEFNKKSFFEDEIVENLKNILSSELQIRAAIARLKEEKGLIINTQEGKLSDKTNRAKVPGRLDENDKFYDEDLKSRARNDLERKLNNVGVNKDDKETILNKLYP
jgi:hypothetical protein